MSKLTELFTAVREENLNKYQLEKYHKELSELYSQMHLEMADIKKKKGLFMAKSPEISTASMKRTWEGSEDGQREIDLKGYIRATSTQLRSLQTRMYNTY